MATNYSSGDLGEFFNIKYNRENRKEDLKEGGGEKKVWGI